MGTTVTVPHGWACLEPHACTIDELCHQLFSFGNHLAWYYRGEPKWYPKRQASLGRHLNATAPTPLDAECNEIARFQHFANFHLTEAERDYVHEGIVAWLTLMQHHGGPTRLLDWTMSPWVAAYAAARDERQHSGFIWAFNPKKLHKPEPWSNVERSLDEAKTLDDYRSIVANTSGEMVLSFVATNSTPRMVAQQGVFTFGFPARVDHAEVIGKHIETGNAQLLVVPNQLKQRLMERLQAMNVTAACLYPGLDGAGRSVYDTMKVGIGSRWLISPRDS